MAASNSEWPRAEGHQETRRHETVRRERRAREHPPQGPPELRWRPSYLAAKQRAERTQALVPHRQADLGHCALLAREQLPGAVDAAPRLKLVRRLAEGAHEHAVKVVGRE